MVINPSFALLNCTPKVQIVVIYALSFIISCIINSAGSNSKKWSY